MRSDIDIFTVLLHVHVGTLIVGTLPFLNVFRNRDMGHGAMTKRGANGFVDYVMDMGRSHDALVVSSNIHVQLVEINVLLKTRADHIVEGMAGNREYRLTIALGVIQAIQKVNTSRSRGGNADSQAAGVLGITAGCKRRRLFMTDLDEFQFFRMGPECLKHSIDPISRKTKNDFYTPID